jgi:hypothetical protein
MAARHFLSNATALPGEDISNPTRRSKAAGETYRAPKLYRGGVELAPRSDLSGYARNGQNLPSAIDVKQSGGTDGTGLCDFDINPTGGDPVRAHLAQNGMQDCNGQSTSAPTADLLRKVSIAGAAPDHPFMTSNRSRQSGGVEKIGKGGGAGSPSGVVPDKIAWNPGTVERKPS